MIGNVADEQRRDRMPKICFDLGYLGNVPRIANYLITGILASCLIKGRDEFQQVGILNCLYDSSSGHFAIARRSCLHFPCRPACEPVVPACEPVVPANPSNSEQAPASCFLGGQESGDVKRMRARCCFAFSICASPHFFASLLKSHLSVKILT